MSDNNTNKTTATKVDAEVVDPGTAGKKVDEQLTDALNDLTNSYEETIDAQERLIDGLEEEVDIRDQERQQQPQADSQPAAGNVNQQPESSHSAEIAADVNSIRELFNSIAATDEAGMKDLATKLALQEDGKGTRKGLMVFFTEEASLNLTSCMRLSQAFKQLHEDHANSEKGAFYSIAYGYAASYIAQALDAARPNGLGRTDFCNDNGTGAYFENGPLGCAGLGLGVVTKETKDGNTTVQRTGIGVYVRADHLMKAKRTASFAY